MMILVIRNICLTLFLCLLTVSAVESQTCLPSCSCIGSNITCSGLSRIPTDFPQEIKDIVIQNSKLDEIGVNSFQNIKSWTSISLRNMDINEIKPGAFSRIKDMQSISFINSNIGTIRGNAFTRINQITSISIKDSNITSIEPFAFNKISNVRASFSINNVNIDVIHSQAFSNFASHAEFELYECNINTIQHNAFNKFSDINGVNVYKNNVNQLQCGTIDYLKSVTDNAKFTFNNIPCDCSIAWLGNAIVSNSGLYIQDTSNTCGSPETRRGMTFEIEIQAVFTECGQMVDCPVPNETEPVFVIRSNSGTRIFDVSISMIALSFLITWHMACL